MAGDKYVFLMPEEECELVELVEHHAAARVGVLSLFGSVWLGCILDQI